MSGPEVLEIVARAKLNLALRVGPLRDDGYHPLESLMVELTDPHDRLTIRRSEERRVVCPEIPERDNLAWSALDALERAVGRPLPVRVDIAKEIPSGAGLGGGSSDAAAVLRATRQIHDLGLTDADLESVAAAVGSDVPFFIRGGAQWARGRGEALSPAPAPRFHAVVCFRGPPLATPAVYARFDALDPPGAPPATDPPRDDPAAMARWVHNDLWPPARDLRPDLADLAADLERAGAAAVLLCGSGAAMCGLFSDEASARRARSVMSRGAAAWLAGPARG